MPTYLNPYYSASVQKHSSPPYSASVQTKKHSSPPNTKRREWQVFIHTSSLSRQRSNMAKKPQRISYYNFSWPKPDSLSFFFLKDPQSLTCAHQHIAIIHHCQLTRPFPTNIICLLSMECALHFKCVTLSCAWIKGLLIFCLSHYFCAYRLSSKNSQAYSELGSVGASSRLMWHNDIFLSNHSYGEI